MTAKYIEGESSFAAWRADLAAGTLPVLFPVADPGSPLARLEVGPGLVTLLGGPPGAGKTALTMQLVVDALRLTPNLRALVANVEMRDAALWDRQLARLSGVDLHAVRRRQVPAEYQGHIAAGLDALAGVSPRLTFVRPPWTVENVARSADAAHADLIVLDYAQRFAPPGDHPHKKAAVDAVMEYVRRMADCGAAVIVVAAVGRQRDEKGRSGYGGLSLASFRESSELEYGADDAFLLVPAGPGAVTLHHAKSRHGEPRDVPLSFTGRVQRFDPAGDAGGGKMAAALADLWDDTAAAAEDE